MSAAIPEQLSGGTAVSRAAPGYQGDGTVTLLAAPHHQPVVIRDIGGEPLLAHRLLELGFTPAQDVMVLAAAPLGGPLAVALRGTIMALRREEAACILL